MKIYRVILCLFCFLFLFSCDNGGNENDNDNLDGFNREILLLNWCDNIIIPAYDSFYNSLEELQFSINTFVEDPSEERLNNISEKWLISYKLWQHVEMFDIGLAEVINYKGKMNIYPIDESLINSNILSGLYDLNNNNNFDARGFPAIDYMLHGLDEDQSIIITLYNSDSGYSKYLVDLIDAMIYNTNLILLDWNSYRNDFINSSGNTATSSLNKIINDFIYYFEKGLRANKIGIPAGVFSVNPLPDKVEAFYKKDVSKELVQEALLASKNFYQGTYFNSSFSDLGLDDYLEYMSSNSSQDNLNYIILEQFSDAENLLNTLGDNFVDQIESDNNQMLYAYDAIQLLVVSFKVDMLQSLSVSVDYIDADGD